MIIDLIKHAKDGRDSVYSGLKELEHAGYLSRVRERDENGKFLSMEYRIYETPQTENPDTDKPTTNGKPGYGKPGYGKSGSGKSDTTNNDSTKNQFNNNDSTNFDDDILKKGGKDPASSFNKENEELIEQFLDYAIQRGIHIDFVTEIADRLHWVNYRLSRYTIGTAVNKTLESIESGSISHVPNYFMTVLDNEVKKVQATERKNPKRQSE
ncbi:hypothetical protein HFD84_23740 [Brevibacillus laterosporus]|nr:hypothetical protein [Brevibacillus laterosporus]